MRPLLFILSFACLGNTLRAQYVYTINADSVKITNHCDTAELILENHTQNVPGFLYNKGRGRTEFRRALQKVNDSIYLVGTDTLRIRVPNAWLQGGNAFGATGVLGTLDTNHLDIYTSGLYRGRWTKGGELLLGTTTDHGYNLQVSGTTYSKVFTNSPDVLGGGNNAPIRLRWGGDEGEYINFYYEGNTSLRGRLASTSDGGPMYLQDAVGFSFNNTPFVAIGERYVPNSPRLGVLNPQGSAVNSFGLARVDPGDANVFDYDMQVTPAGNVVIGANTDNGNKFQINGTSYFSDNTGIGTSSPSAQLHTTGTVRFAGLTPDTTETRVLISDVYGNLYYRNLSSWAVNNTFNSSLTVNGVLNAQSVNVKPGCWADYVFDNTYRLPSLPEVENFIKHNRHLPGMPAAAEVQKKGIDIGETQATLLKKIEELTLYVIEQDKQSKKQREEINALKEQNKELDVLKQQMIELKKLITAH